jgi:hypothetical protein
MYDKFSGSRLVGEILIDDFLNKDYIHSFIEKSNKRKILKRFSEYIISLINYDKNKHLINTISNLVKNNVLVIINHNDATSNEELKKISSKSDNDKNTVFITDIISTFRAEVGLEVNKVIYLTNTN